MTKRSIKVTTGAVTMALAVSALSVGSAAAQDFDWRAHEGESITFLANRSPLDRWA